MGGIDEAALDRLSLVTEMTHHIRVKAAGDADPAELGPFSPAFLWLLRDFYLDLSEDGRSITPRDYLERALQPTPGTSKAVHAKNQVGREAKPVKIVNRQFLTQKEAGSLMGRLGESV